MSSPLKIKIEKIPNLKGILKNVRENMRGIYWEPLVKAIKEYKPKEDDINAKVLGKYDGWYDPENPERYFDPHAIDVRGTRIY